ncbi:MAG: acyltransferase family protein [Burkholderiaceae bacterium]|jgi:peptidoglycan/LPS O-acetylase OafA/YrhL|nr:acyltransferase family protein [Burkholderiaceae bacterium]
MASVPAAADALPWVTWGKAVASQVIVWHHLLLYGPLATTLDADWPAATAFVYDYGRMAVQVFLVMGGFLAARSLWPAPDAPRIVWRDWPARVWARYLRLLPMLLLALAAAIAAAALARAWMNDADTPAAPTLAQLLAHVLLLQDIAGQPALSAGIWYVAIDLQLFALLAALAALARAALPQARAAACALPLLAGVALSLTWFNRQPEADVWGHYFLGAYGLGVLAAWGRHGARRGGATLLLALLTALALLIDWRERIALAGVTALALLWQPRAAALTRARLAAFASWLAAISYGVYLLHYPLSLTVSALTLRLTPATHGWRVAGLAATWLLTLLCGWLASRWLEAPPQRGRRRRFEHQAACIGWAANRTPSIAHTRSR